MKKMKLRSVKQKLDLIIGSLTMLFALFLFLYFPYKFEQELLKSIENNARSITQISSIIVGAGLFFDDYEAISEGIEPITQDKNISFIIIVDKSDSIYYIYNKKKAEGFDYKSYGDNSLIRTDEDLCLSSDIVMQDNFVGRLHLGYSLTTLHHELAQIKNTITIISVIILLVGIILTRFLSAFIISPLKKMVETANQIAKGNLTLRTKITTDDEIGYLASSFNNMLDMIQVSQKELETKNKILSEEISVREIIEQNLKESESRFRVIFHKSNDLIHLGEIIDEKTDRIIEVNNAMREILGYTTEELFGMSHRDLLSPIYRDTDELTRMVLTDGFVSRESVYQTKSGENIIVEINANLFDLLGRKVYLSIARNITDRKQAEAALIESEERFRSIYNNATIGIYRSTEDGEILMANPAIVEMLGFFSFKEMIDSKILKDVYAKTELRKQFIDMMKEKGIVSGFETIWIKSDGSKIYVRESARVVKNASGEVDFYEGVVEDITKWKETELALIKAKERAEESDRLKSEFLAQMSHEIRTPINTIMNFTSLLRMETEDKIPDELAGGFDSIENAANRLLRTINLVLNMSDIESGTYEAHMTKINVLSEVINPVCSEFFRNASKKNLKLNIYNECTDENIFGDLYTITQIMVNLVDNAIKYTDKGEVKITMKDENEKMLVSICDTGIGIASEYLPKLFRKFSQEEQGYTRRYEGNGLGLALVKEYCDINKTEIHVESKKGDGTCFRLLIPKNEI